MTLDEKYERLQEILRQLGSVVVAFSGGVDSTFLLKTAHDTLGDENVLALTADSAIFPGFELEDAKKFCETEKIRHRIIHAKELEIEGFAENPPNRCYLCKKAKFSAIRDLAKEEGYAAVCDGTNQSDVGTYRPGMKALEELGIRSPLKEAGLVKQEIRDLSRRLGLPTWNKPSYACLASRFAYGEEITEERLKMVGAAENFLMSLGFRSMRVRLHGGILARIEVPEEQLGALLQHRKEILEEFRRLGFVYVTMDLAGFRSGSMDAVLKKDGGEDGGAR